MCCRCCNFFKSRPKGGHSIFCFKFTLFKIATKVTKYLGYFCKKYCCQELSKVAQSGRTDCRANPTSTSSRRSINVAIKWNDGCVDLQIQIKFWRDLNRIPRTVRRNLIDNIPENLKKYKIKSVRQNFGPDWSEQSPVTMIRVQILPISKSILFLMLWVVTMI